jgi:VWFA-related protein
MPSNRIPRIPAKLTVLSGVVLASTWLGAQEKPQFRATTDLVFRDVRVLDAQGRSVMDLAKTDFRVVEDGIEQQIVWFVRSVGDKIVTDDKPRVPPAEGLIVPARGPDDRSGRILIVLIDDLHLQGRDSPKVRKVLQTLRDEVVKSNDRIALVSTGYSAIEQNLTLDPYHKRFDAAIDQVMGSAPSPAEVIAAPTSAQGPVGLRWNAHVAFRTAYSLLEQLEKIPGRRKAFFYVSNGYDFNPFESSRLKAEMDRWATPKSDPGSSVNPFESRGQQFSESDLAVELMELVRAANRANTAFYPIDPRGLVDGPDIDQNVRADEWWKHVNAGISSLQVLAGETNGRAVVNTNNFAAEFRRINTDLADYYVLGYYSSNQDSSRRTRLVEISASRPSLRLEYQNRYTLRPGK